jgi:hypothetical protein
LGFFFFIGATCSQARFVAFLYSELVSDSIKSSSFILGINPKTCGGSKIKHKY